MAGAANMNGVHRTTVKLIGVPLKQQGTHDSLCAYYAAAMLLVALRPELEDELDAAHVRRDPLIGNLPRRNGQKIERLASEWLAAGVHLERVCAAMNAACARGPGRVSTRFAFQSGARVRRSLERVREQIDRGLPCVLAWESRQMGNHTVLVYGYERYAPARRQAPGDWLRVHDPARVQDLLEWSQLERHADRRLELLVCTEHTGFRPDKLTTRRGRTGALLARGTELSRWHPAQGWQSITGR